MACTKCSSELVLLASSMAVLTAGVDSFDPSVASNILVGYMANKASTPLSRCRNYQHPCCRCAPLVSLIALSLVPRSLYPALQRGRVYFSEHAEHTGNLRQRTSRTKRVMRFLKKMLSEGRELMP